MPRPAPKVLLELVNKKTRKTDQILASDGVWAVYYNSKPINIKTRSLIAFVAPKYKTTSFANKGHAINLARKLNKQFDTKDFTVVTLQYADTIYTE